MNNTSINIGAGIGILMLVCFLCAIAAIPTFFLWNWLMPIIFGLTKITFIQAIGVTFLSMILFRGISVSSN